MFISNQSVKLTFDGKIVTAHPTPLVPVVFPINSLIPIVNIQPVITNGSRPLIVNGPPCTITLYGVGIDGKLYEISSVAWMSPPQIVQWTLASGPPMPGNMTPTLLEAFKRNNVLDLGFTVNPTSPGKLMGMSFTEQAPPSSPNTVSNIQVTSVVVMNAPLPDGSMQGWTFNDLLSTVASGTVLPPPTPTYDVTVIVPGDPPFTSRLLNIPASCITTE